jgi:hypothetical protein
VSRQLIRLAFAVSVLGMAAAAYGQSTGLVVTGGKGPAQAPRFYGFTFDFTVSESSGLNAVGQNYQNDLLFYLEPSWNIGRQFLRDSKYWRNLTLAGRFVVTQNLAGIQAQNFNGTANAGPSGTCWTGSPSETGGVVNPNTIPYCNPVGNDRRTDYGDIWLTLRAPRLFTIPKAGLPINPQFRVILPVSAQSRFSNLAMSMALGVGTGRSLPFWKDRIRIGYSFLFNKNFHTNEGSRFPVSDSRITVRPTGENAFDYAGGLSSDFFTAGREGPVNTNNNYSFLNIFSGGIQIHDKVAFDAIYILSSGVRYGLPCTPLNVNGLMEDICANGDAVAAASGTAISRPGFLHSQILWVTLNYQVLDYLGLSLAWINFAPLTNDNGTYQQGIVSVDYNAFTSVSLSATISIDGVINRLSPRKPDPTKQAGIPTGPGRIF